MAESKKLSEKQMQKLQSFQSEMQKLQSEIGSFEIQIEVLKSKKAKSIQSVYENQQKLEMLMKDVEEEFGSGSIDINTGEFTPSPNAQG